MAGMRVNPQWVTDAVNEYRDYDFVERTTAFNKAIQALIIRFDNLGIMYRLYSLGAGVKKLTTDTDVCPCCKRKL